VSNYFYDGATETKQARSLIITPSYESYETPEGDVEMRVTFNGGNTFAVAVVKADGTVEGDMEDKKSIVADCMDCPINDVRESEVDDFLRMQADYDHECNLAHEEALAEES